MPVPRKMMRSIIRRLNTSICATFNWRSSMMYGVIDEVMYPFSVVLLMPRCFTAYLLNSSFGNMSEVRLWHKGRHARVITSSRAGQGYELIIAHFPLLR